MTVLEKEPGAAIGSDDRGGKYLVIKLGSWPSRTSRLCRRRRAMSGE